MYSEQKVWQLKETPGWWADKEALGWKRERDIGEQGREGYIPSFREITTVKTKLALP